MGTQGEKTPTGFCSLDVVMNDVCSVYRYLRSRGVQPLMQCTEDPNGVCHEGMHRCVKGEQLKRTVKNYQEFLGKCL